MKISEIIRETTSAGAIASVANPSATTKKKKNKKQKKFKNALDSDNIFQGHVIKR